MAQQYDNTESYRWHRENLPLRMGSKWYGQIRTSFNMVNTLTHLANLPRPLTKHNEVWLTGLSGRYPHEYIQVERRVKRQGGPSLNPAPLARIEWVIRIGFG